MKILQSLAVLLSLTLAALAPAQGGDIRTERVIFPKGSTGKKGHETPTGVFTILNKESTAPRSVVHPGMLTPVSANSGTPQSEQALALTEDYRWEPQASPAGPLTLVVSGADKRVVVLRNGVEIGRAGIAIDDPAKPLGTRAYTVLAGSRSGHPRWNAVGLPGHAAHSRGAHDPEAAERLRFPRTLTDNLYPLLAPGTTMLITDAPVLEHTTGRRLYVMRSGKPQSAPLAESPRPETGCGAPAPVESIRLN